VDAVRWITVGDLRAQTSGFAYDFTNDPPGSPGSSTQWPTCLWLPTISSSTSWRLRSVRQGEGDISAPKRLRDVPAVGPAVTSTSGRRE
jgi:hypothetical protein